MAYSATYEAGDLSKVTIDMIVTAAVQVMEFIALFVIIWLLTRLVKAGKSVGLAK